jgi:hypothetical protein
MKLEQCSREEANESVIEDGSEFFRYNRRIVKEDFSYYFNKKLNPNDDSSLPDTSRLDPSPETARNKNQSQKPVATATKRTISSVTNINANSNSKTKLKLNSL